MLKNSLIFFERDFLPKGLKNFSRLDEEEFKAVNIHEGIDSTVEIIQYLCEHRIEIIKDYADLPHLAL